jgi:hypothetical protein
VSQETFYVVVTIAAVVITVSFLIQAAMFIFIYGAIKKLTVIATSLQAKAEPVIEKVAPVIDKVSPVIEQVQVTLSSVKETVEKISTQARETFDKVSVESRAIAAAVSATSLELTGLARHQAEQLSATVDQATSTLQRQVVEFDHLLARTQDRIEGTTLEVQTTVLQPMREVSALMVGIKRTIEALFGRDRKQIDQAYQDEEMFI